jgi:hypothetical protein
VVTVFESCQLAPRETVLMYSVEVPTVPVLPVPVRMPYW